MLDKEKLLRLMGDDIPLMLYDITDSTNERAKHFLKERACEQAVFLANEQSHGRGRNGRSFYSPADTGIYLTYAFRTLQKETILRVTTAACVAAAKALDCGADIKWVNDLYLHGKKIGGILTESLSVDPEHFYLLVGVGINLSTRDFPDSIREKAGSIGSFIDRESLVASLCRQLSHLPEDICSDEYLAYYRRHLLAMGKSIIYTENGQNHQAVIEDVDSFGGLIVREKGERKILRSGEISLMGNWNPEK